MKKTLILILLLGLTLVLSGCGHYGGMGHRYTNSMHYNQQSGSDYVFRNGMQSNGPYMR